MAWFNQKEEKEKNAKEVDAAGATAPKKAKAVKSSKGRVSATNDFSYVLLRPRITEKATDCTAHGVYVFDVAPNANKRQIASSIQQVYNVSPEKVRIAKVTKKHVRHARTGIEGVKSGGKKAYVYLKEGDSISIM